MEHMALLRMALASSLAHLLPVLPPQNPFTLLQVNNGISDDSLCCNAASCASNGFSRVQRAAVQPHRVCQAMCTVRVCGPVTDVTVRSRTCSTARRQAASRARSSSRMRAERAAASAAAASLRARALRAHAC